MPGVAAWATAAAVAAGGDMGVGEPVVEAAAVVAVGTEEGEGTGWPLAATETTPATMIGEGGDLKVLVVVVVELYDHWW